MISPSDLAGAMLGTLFITLGVAAMAAAGLRAGTRDRALLWFGLFTLLYGVRLLARSAIVDTVVGVPLGLSPVAWQFVDTSITYIILVPASLLVTTVIGTGWRGILRYVWQVDLLCGGAAIVWDLAKGSPGAAMGLNPVLVAGNFLAGAASLATDANRQRWTRDAWLVAAGAAVFAVVALYETFRGGLLHGADAEPLAMLLFLACLGSVVVKHMFQNERRVAGLERELETARRIQTSILPRRPPEVASLSVASHYDSMAEVAGDFFDFVVTPSGRLGILVADVSGHGVPAAIVASMVKIALATQGDDVDDPGAVLTRMNRALCGRFELAYVTAVFALLDPRARTLAYASAGHPPPILVRRDGRPERLEAGGLILGVMPDVDYTTTLVADLQTRDKLVLYTDGLTEAARADGEFFGDRRFQEFLATRHAGTPEQFTTALVETAGRWTGVDFADDVTIVVAEYSEDART